jgi:2-keto-3-deoxy-L-rhamnonate aldolase RhmA
LRYLEQGFTFVAVGSDVGLLAQTSANLAARFKALAVTSR